MANVRITGVKAFEKKLLQIENQIATKIVNQATLQGINVIKKQAIDNTPKSENGVRGNKRFTSRNHDAGNLKKSVVQKKIRAKNKHYFGRITGYKSGGGGNGDGWYGGFVEYNVKNRGGKSSRLPSKPITRAYEMKKMAAMQKVIQVMAIKLKQIVK